MNDAFGASHRAHASTEGVARILPAYAGLLLDAEVRVLTAAGAIDSFLAAGTNRFGIGLANRTARSD